jgi:cyclopropane fatty-acyl-phospholipid synthase-like methyltransferase
MARTMREVVYLDLPSPQRDFAEWRFHHHNLFIPCVGATTEIDSASIDTIVAVDVIEHIHPDRLPRLAAEFARVLAPGGAIIEASDFNQHDGAIPLHFVHSEELWNEAKTRAGLICQTGIWTRAATLPQAVTTN